MENRHRWEQPLSDRTDYDVDVVVETSLAMAQATIQTAMRESKIRNADLAERLDRPRSFISKMLSGSHNLTVKTLSRAMAACGYELTGQYQPIQWGWVADDARDGRKRGGPYLDRGRIDRSEPVPKRRPAQR